VSVADDLMAARDLLDGGRAWTQGSVARNAQGKAVAARSAQAVRWCATGALYAVAGSARAHDVMWRAGGRRTVAGINDAAASFEPVADLLDDAIRAAKDAGL